MRDLAVVEQETANIIDAIAKGMFHKSMKVRMDGLEKRKFALTAQLEQLPEEDRSPCIHG